MIKVSRHRPNLLSRIKSGIISLFIPLESNPFENGIAASINNWKARRQHKQDRKSGVYKEEKAKRILADAKIKNKFVQKSLKRLKSSPLKSFLNDSSQENFLEALENLTDEQILQFEKIDLKIIEGAFNILVKKNPDLNLRASETFLSLTEFLPGERLKEFSQNKFSTYMKAYKKDLGVVVPPLDGLKNISSHKAKVEKPLNNVAPALNTAVTIDELEKKIQNLIDKGETNSVKYQSLIAFCQSSNLVKDMTLGSQVRFIFNKSAPPVTQDDVIQKYKTAPTLYSKTISANFALINNMAHRVAREGIEYLSFGAPSYPALTHAAAA